MFRKKQFRLTLRRKELNERKQVHCPGACFFFKTTGVGVAKSAMGV